MVLADVNVLVYAYRKEHARHREFRNWLSGLVNGREAFAVSELVLSGVVRILTHPRVFAHPDPLDRALAFVNRLREVPHAVVVQPGPRHWDIFAGLCTQAQARGNLVPDAYLAALAIEHGCVFATTDRDYARFPGLRWKHPLQG
jgi:uncharacterized protein